MSRWRVTSARLLALGVALTFGLATLQGLSLLSTNSALLSCRCPVSNAKDSAESKAPHEDKNDVQTSDKKKDDEHLTEHVLCVLVPFRDRFEELLEFAPYLSTFLSNQNVKHKIVVINQADKFRFNRASLINAGFLETRRECDYIAMHDVDLLPQNNQLRYAYPADGPFHLAAPWLHPRYHYKTFVGGILLLTSKHFEQLNGLSNRYWGWGREDDEFYVRMKKAKLKLNRPGNLTTGYKSFRHIHDRRKRPRDFANIDNQKQRTNRLDKVTGLTTINYTVNLRSFLQIEKTDVFVLNVNLECDINKTPWCLSQEDHDKWQKQREKERSESLPLAHDAQR